MTQVVQHLCVRDAFRLQPSEQRLPAESQRGRDGLRPRAARVQDRKQQALDAATGGPRVVQALQERIAALSEHTEDVARLLGDAPGRDGRVHPQGVPVARERHGTLEYLFVLGVIRRRRVRHVDFQDMRSRQEAPRAADQAGECAFASPLRAPWTASRALAKGPTIAIHKEARS
jgi:hypothetical protein